MENNRYVQILQGALRTAQDPAQRLSKALDAYKQIDTRLARLKNQPDQKDSALRNLFVTNLVNSDFVAAGSGIRDHAKYSSVSSFYELDKSTFLSLVKDRREWSYLLESIGLMTWPVSKVLLKEILKDKDLIEQEKDDDSCSFSVALAMAGILSARLSPKFPADEEADDTKVLIDLIETVEEAIKKALQKKPKEKEASTSRNLVFSLLLFHLAACPSASQQMPIKFGAGNVR